MAMPFGRGPLFAQFGGRLLLTQFRTQQRLPELHLALPAANLHGGDDAERSPAKAQGVVNGGHPDIDAVAAADVGDAIPAAAGDEDALAQPLARPRAGAGMRRRPPVRARIDMIGRHQHAHGISRQQRGEAKR